MKKSLKIILLALAMVCFISTATNVVLTLHLIEHHDDENHDSEHCPICQQAVVNVVKAVLPNISIAIEQLQVTITNIRVNKYSAKDFKFLTPYQRAPPLAA